MSTRPIYITAFDMKRLRELIEDIKRTSRSPRDDLKRLEGELGRAIVVDPKDVPPNVVTMNSQVYLEDLETGEESVYTLVFPQDANLSAGKISILAPVGTGMLGYSVGDTFEWPVPEGVRKLEIIKILYQPEAAGDYNL